MLKKNKSVLLQYRDKTYYCPVELTLDLIGGKWKGVIIWYLGNSTLRFTELKKNITTISEKMLSRELKSLEDNGILSRKVYPEIPPKVEYTLTPYGKTLLPIFNLLSEWGDNHVRLHGSIVTEDDHNSLD